MNKERAILQRLLNGDNMGDFFISNELLKEVEQCLAQHEQKPLSDEDLKQIYEKEKFDYLISQQLFNIVARRIETAHGIGVDNE